MLTARGASRLGTILAQWGRIGCFGVGGPPTHIPLLRRLCVTERGWLSAEEFEDGIAATNLLPGPLLTGISGGLPWVALTVGALSYGGGFVIITLMRADAVDRYHWMTGAQFLNAVAPAAIGAIAGSAVPLGLTLHHPWQAIVLGLAAVWLLLLRRGVVTAVLGSAALGVIAALFGLAAQ